MTPVRNLEAYRMLYAIENHLRSIITESNVKQHIHNPTLYDLIYIVERTPNKTVSNEAIRKLYWIVDVRNKVCHMQEINEWEYDLLVDCYGEVFGE